MMQQTFDLERWLVHHEQDRPEQLKSALNEVPREQRTLALLTWLHEGDLQGERIQLSLG
ncbi:hypothetical protein [Deinococcus peraridilitoris]|uniref:Uncharacterized protein n=1 Tax=Deinococcus peraridilitoris (strain DSM 19664 / LMG 22246 / CIP 109416 / KR-200) TaxID=937777 RepID=K9ZWC9_DEIPD|nr:hypothetical protein [Deinococcus peraridilitoris]AFZ65948.1 hypothetical protein Deipe_0348 [Deinococcus peraridilitoris DSM 19664]